MKRFVVILGLVAAASACSNSDSTTSPSAGTSQAKFTVDMQAANETPPTTGAEANAKGAANITFNLSRDASGSLTSTTAVFDVTLSQFPSTSNITAAHIHPGRVGVAGGVLVSTTLTSGEVSLSSNGSGQFTKASINVPVDQAQAIMADPAGYYFNVHSSANPTGVIRGQLVRTQ